ncbi:MAG: cytochrome c biogenesis protein ResB, partial [Candidatus Obscuribacterales bacterium]|nr:cytochrome c biogenesis protein ResB [Candidatus Obscuribacterales bacterium]
MKQKQWREVCLKELASLNLTFILLALLIFLSMAGAWIPQADTISQSELTERFGTDGKNLLAITGLGNVFHSPLFLTVVSLVFINLICCTALTMAPRIKNKLMSKDFKSPEEIEQLSLTESFLSKRVESPTALKKVFQQRGFKVRLFNQALVAEKGRLGWLAAPLTHLGLFILLAGVIVSSLTGYSGILFLSPGESLKLDHIQKTKPTLGAVPSWTVKLNSTYRDNYPNGKPKQWYSKLEIGDGKKVVRKGEVSVNNPFLYDGVEFYQSDWKIEAVKLTLAGEEIRIPVQEMAGEYMGALPLIPQLLIIVSVENTGGPVKIYLKSDESQTPKLLTSLKSGGTHNLGRLSIKYDGIILKSGLQYKHDPGQPVVYTAFIFLFLGAIFVATPS